MVVVDGKQEKHWKRKCIGRVKGVQSKRKRLVFDIERREMFGNTVSFWH